MGFRKTSIAVDTRVLDQDETRKVASGRAAGPPSNPRIGQRWEDMVWDGRAWVDADVYASRQAQG
jgi:hypothetical protein